MDDAEFVSPFKEGGNFLINFIPAKGKKTVFDLDIKYISKIKNNIGKSWEIQRPNLYVVYVCKYWIFRLTYYVNVAFARKMKIKDFFAHTGNENIFLNFSPVITH